MTASIELPDKKYFNIGEVSRICEVSKSVLRTWETKFDCLQNVHRRNNRRYYTKENIRDIGSIKTLIQERGFTISGANQHMNSSEVSDVVQRVPVPRLRFGG